MGKTYTSMRGKQVDMERLSLLNELTPAVSNMKINARGDELGQGGKIVKTREEILKDYYSKNPGALKEEVVSKRK